MNLKGLIFDMDGVVVDNHSYHFKAWMAFAEKHKFPLNAEIYRDHYNGKTNADLFRMIFGEVTQGQIDAFSAEKEGMYQELYAAHMKPHAGLVDFLDWAQSERWRIALGTSAPTMNVDYTLDRLFLRKYFDVIVDGSMVSFGKPHPQVYQQCSWRLNCDPEDCAVFEDSLAGLESAKRAGCTLVGVATSHTVSELTPLTSKIIHDFTEARGILGI